MMAGMAETEADVRSGRSRVPRYAQGRSWRPATCLGHQPARVGCFSGIYIQTTSRAVTTALTVATGSRIFQPNRISWS